MAKSKLKAIEEADVTTTNVRKVFTPIKKKYKPLPKFNGKCPNC